MPQPAISRSGLIVLIGLLVGSPGVAALEVEPGASAGLLFTDNARLSADNEEDDLIAVGYVGANVDHSSGALHVNADAGLTYLNYTGNTFDNQNFPALRLTGDYEQIRDRLDWHVRNFLTQTLLNVVEGTTPDNVQNFNAFTFGPTIRFQPSGRQTITVSPEYRSFTFEKLANDNQQFELAANWLYRMYPTLAVNLDGSVTETVYDGDGNFADFTRTAVHAGLAGTTARSSYSLNLGVTQISRDESGNTTRPTGDLTWSRNLSGHSTAKVYIASDLTDTGQLLLGSITDPDNGGSSNIQVSNNAFRANRARLTYQREDATLKTEVWWEFLEQDFLGDQGDEFQQIDRKTNEIGASMDYRVTAVLSSGLHGRYTRTRETDGDRRNKRYSIAATVGYQLTAKLRTSLELRYENQDNDLDLVNEFNEFSTFVKIAYGLGAGQGAIAGRSTR